MMVASPSRYTSLILAFVLVAMACTPSWGQLRSSQWPASHDQANIAKKRSAPQWKAERRRTPASARLRRSGSRAVRPAAWQETGEAELVAPGATGNSLQPVPSSPEVISGPTILENSWVEGEYIEGNSMEHGYSTQHGYSMQDGSYVEHGGMHGGKCDGCGSVGSCCCLPIGCFFDWRRVDVWAGVQAFNGEGDYLTTGVSSDGQVDGNVGFQQGFNLGLKIPCILCGQLGGQFGMRFTQSQLHGSTASADSRNQVFLTGGFYRRVDYGLQGGLVFDYLNDNWIARAELLQLRGEVSFLCSPCHDFGFRFTNSQKTLTDQVMVAGSTAPINLQLRALNSYRFFYRYRFGDCGRGLADFHLGWTENSGTLLGFDLMTPLHGQLGLETTGTYVTPKSNTTDAYTKEGFNLGVAFVWTPRRPFGSRRDYYRPLMRVADNGTFMQQQLP